MGHLLFFIYAVIITCFWSGLAIYILYNKRRIRFLKDIATNGNVANEVVIIIAVRNEEEHLAGALQSVCDLAYPNYRIFLINDRSTDRTADIMQSFVQKYPHITVHTITELPEGWLGKNHALYQGYLHTKAEWILFTDADVVFEKESLQRAMNDAIKEKVDHLTILPEVASRSKWLNSILATFVIMLEARHRPWALRNKRSSAYLGIGAFNLVNRKTYEAIGTHKAFALRPDDDLMLGKRIKESGAVQDALYGEQQISLEWYTSVKEFVNGLMKNSFTAFNYNFFLLLLGVVATLVSFVLPMPLLFVFGDAIERMMALAILLALLILFTFSKGNNAKWWYAFMNPVAGAVMTFILLRAGWLAFKNKGIYWRDHFYSLDELKKGL